jgi:Glycine-rich domain-containing protein-like
MVKGLISGSVDQTPEETGKADMGFILEVTLEFPKGAARPYLRNYIGTSSNPRWGEIIPAIKKTRSELEKARLIRMLSRSFLFESMQISYMGIMWRDLSIDLVAASLRQREFAKKIISEEFLFIEGQPGFFNHAITRYHKFLLLIKWTRSRNKKDALVPTMDIDLCWHTHQLYSAPYRKWCCEHVGVAVNHNDAAAKETLDNGLHETCQAWYEAYREDYLGYAAPQLNVPEPSKARRKSAIRIPFMKKKSEGTAVENVGNRR